MHVVSQERRILHYSQILWGEDKTLHDGMPKYCKCSEGHNFLHMQGLRTKLPGEPRKSFSQIGQANDGSSRFHAWGMCIYFLCQVAPNHN